MKADTAKTPFQVTRFVPRNAWIAAGGAFAAGLLGGACGAGFIALVNTALHRPELSRSMLAAAFAALVIGKVGSNAFARWVLNGFTLRTLTALSQDLSRRVLATPLRRLEEVGVHRILATLTEDVAMIGWAAQSLPTLATNATVLIGCAIYLGYLSWQLLLALTVITLTGFALHRSLLRRTYRYLQRVRERRDTLFQHFRALTEGTKELKLNRDRRRAFLTERIDHTTEMLRLDGVAGMKYDIYAGVSGQMLFYTLLGALMFAAPLGGGLDSETVTGYILAALYMMNRVWSLTSAWPTFARGKISIDKVRQLGLDLDRIDADAPLPPAVNDEWNEIVFEDVTFAYPPDLEGQAFVLGPIDLSLRRGELVFLIGGNGSGKSTLMKVLTGLYPPATGEVRVDDVPVTDENREEYCQRFAAIFSDFYLFDTLLGIGRERDADAARYLRDLELTGKVEIRDGALSTTALSQGQRKRLAMLTALLEDRSIYVFDEWAADQDPHYREVFYCRLLPELKARGKTVIVITHDDRYFHLGDRIIKLDCGRVVAADEAVAAIA